MAVNRGYWRRRSLQLQIRIHAHLLQPELLAVERVRIGYCYTVAIEKQGSDRSMNVHVFSVFLNIVLIWNKADFYYSFIISLIIHHAQSQYYSVQLILLGILNIHLFQYIIHPVTEGVPWVKTA
jgi:hypothetical protein